MAHLVPSRWNELPRACDKAEVTHSSSITASPNEAPPMSSRTKYTSSTKRYKQAAHFCKKGPSFLSAADRMIRDGNPGSAKPMTLERPRSLGLPAVTSTSASPLPSVYSNSILLRCHRCTLVGETVLCGRFISLETTSNCFADSPKLHSTSDSTPHPDKPVS